MTADADPTRRGRSALSDIRRMLPVCLLTVLTAMAEAQPFTPGDDDYTVEELPSSVIALSRQRRAQEARSDRALTPDQLLEQAMDSYRIATLDGSPRAYGRTLSLLGRWPSDAETPARYHILMASVLQHNHEFDSALQQLDAALARDPDNAQAILVQAQIGLVTGDHEMTRSSCRQLGDIARDTVQLNCQAQLDGVTGNAARALQAIDDRLNDGRAVVPQDRFELALTAAVIAHRLGQFPRAEGHYLRVLQQMPTHQYALTRYANLLLDSGQADRLARLLAGYQTGAMDAELRILLTVALAQIESEDAQDRRDRLVDTLQEEFRVARLREEALAYKEYARYSLDLVDQPRQALDAARENWSQQREPSDAMLLARAAAATGATGVITDLRTWMNETGLEYPRLRLVLGSGGETVQ